MTSLLSHENYTICHFAQLFGKSLEYLPTQDLKMLYLFTAHKISGLQVDTIFFEWDDWYADRYVAKEWLEALDTLEFSDSEWQWLSLEFLAILSSRDSKWKDKEPLDLAQADSYRQEMVLEFFVRQCFDERGACDLELLYELIEEFEPDYRSIQVDSIVVRIAETGGSCGYAPVLHPDEKLGDEGLEYRLASKKIGEFDAIAR